MRGRRRKKDTRRIKYEGGDGRRIRKGNVKRGRRRKIEKEERH